MTFRSSTTINIVIGKKNGPQSHIASHIYLIS